MGAHFRITPAHRTQIEDQIEALIAILDRADPDPDLEDDDPAGDPLDVGELEEFLPITPIYGLDQTRGPVNEQEAHDEWRRLLAVR